MTNKIKLSPSTASFRLNFDVSLLELGEHTFNVELPKKEPEKAIKYIFKNKKTHNNKNENELF